MSEHGGCITVTDRRLHFDETVLHDWRLVSREWFDASYVTVREGQPGVKNPDAIGWQETWYCTRCRKVEERKT